VSVPTPSDGELGLVMIVKNEEAVIERCLTHALHYCDTFTILDTGSEDDTREIVWRMVKERGIGGLSLREDFQDFSTSLNSALAHARQTAKWLIRLDADMVLKAEEGWQEALASAPDDVDYFLIPVKDAGQMYWLPLLVRGGLEWRYVFPTHEYLVFEYLDGNGRKYGKFEYLHVIHLHDGGMRSTKYVRDLALLAELVEQGDVRAIFYSAQSYEGLGATDRAIELYERRARMGGFEEERWFASYKAAALRRDVDALFTCHRHRPWRSEPLLAAARIVAENGPGDDVLFLDHLVLTDPWNRLVR
jgi:glycosyltransferase involved in cell wall biosynthesis